MGSSTYDWKLVRNVAVASLPDADGLLAQTVLPAANRLVLENPDKHPDITVQMVGVFFDALAGDPVVDALGTFSLRVLLELDVPVAFGGGASVLITGTAVAAKGSRVPFLVSDCMSGDTIGVQITAVAGSAASTHLRIYAREIRK